MTYEIPQQLQYEEKIIFGLNFKQLLYAIIFFPIGIIIFLKSGLNLEIKLTLSLIPILIGVAFMFFDLKDWLSSVWQWLKFREVFLNGFENENVLGIKEC